ncbi:MAG: hypothetical protein CFE21_05430 [Bacteroidetes bacterium B1(2017)]|nr:MAG: hypothetical protein CFE21_05430 [Bacteroidetes bacterium B1(2017)]
MKRKSLLSLALLALVGIGIPTLQSTPNGAPSDGRTGSPGDGGKTCFSGGCHSGAPTDATGIISSNVPAEGYTAGTSYTITVTVDGANRKGFCVSPQKTDGTQMGTLTAGTGNFVSGKYVTHSVYKTTSPAVWTFTWVAPAAGSGPVDFYGAFANSTFTTRKTKVTINEKAASGINENNGLNHLSIYPNPLSSSDMHIGFDLKKQAQVQISLLDMTGKEVAVLKDAYLTSGAFEEQFALPTLTNGIYFVRIQSNQDIINRKVLVQQP